MVRADLCSLLDRRVDFIDQVSDHCGSSLARIIYEKVKFFLQMVRWFLPGFFGFHSRLMNDQLEIPEIFLKRP